ncbi:hypothetical protein FG135_09065 [Vibrio cholerae]|uniref:beta/gamma crystallin-related protein n=4 Tax=Vibrio cholerae TaxID=666 RepID=UPI0004E3521A|nr:beta/gamma crystallin-related protein [Vibrio cholerae]EGR0683672.1 hypothetical protein [Vibrio cholerae]EGR1090948.1 hypothetical protein [Vibrio cholerae]EJL6880479.1 hypothetical protein [Vibrio cholerae]KFE22039.1 beta/Gamma crystallin family protein [Vibrio cholerae]MBC9067158.1 hypothetical protein [Vibrio cholerae]
MKLKSIGLILTSLWCINAEAANGGSFVRGYELDYLYDSYAGYTNREWMKLLPDEVKISALSIPGTNSSLSRYGGDIPAKQTLSLDSQLDMGIRFFDARFKFRDGKLYAYSGLISQYQTFDEFLYTISRYLDAYPSESIMIRIRNEEGGYSFFKEFSARFEQVVKQYEHNLFIPKNSNFTLGEARGKFTFIYDDQLRLNKRMGLSLDELTIQDDSHIYDNWKLYDKWQAIKDHFSNIQSSQETKISINYLSASGGSFPYFVASGKSSHGSHDNQLLTGIATVDKRKWPDFPRVSCLGSLCSIIFLGTNQLTSKWIDSNPVHLGVVAADFPGGRLVDKIISRNFQQQQNQCMYIYEHMDFRGQSMRICNDIPDLGPLNNKLSSYKLPKGWQVRFFDGKNYTGGYYTRESNSTDNSMTYDFNDKIESIKILKK